MRCGQEQENSFRPLDLRCVTERMIMYEMDELLRMKILDLKNMVAPDKFKWRVTIK